MQRRQFLAVIPASGLVAACGGSGDGDAPEDPAPGVPEPPVRTGTLDALRLPEESRAVYAGTADGVGFDVTVELVPGYPTRQRFIAWDLVRADGSTASVLFDTSGRLRTATNSVGDLVLQLVYPDADTAVLAVFDGARFLGAARVVRTEGRYSAGTLPRFSLDPTTSLANVVDVTAAVNERLAANAQAFQPYDGDTSDRQWIRAAGENFGGFALVFAAIAAIRAWSSVPGCTAAPLACSAAFLEPAVAMVFRAFAEAGTLDGTRSAQMNTRRYARPLRSVVESARVRRIVQGCPVDVVFFGFLAMDDEFTVKGSMFGMTEMRLLYSYAGSCMNADEPRTVKAVLTGSEFGRLWRGNSHEPTTDYEFEIRLRDAHHGSSGTVGDRGLPGPDGSPMGTILQVRR